MEKFKIELYEKENNKDFPQYESLSESECQSIQDNIRKKLFISNNANLLDVVKQLSRMQKHIPDVNAKDENFALSEILLRLGIETKKSIYLNWYRFDEIDQFNLNDLVQNFDDIWFSGTDDIDLFDESLNWVLSIRHDGCLSLLKY